MSGSTGAERVKSRVDFDKFLKSYSTLLSSYPGVKSISTSGSYNSNPNKQDFGDIDLIIHIESSKSKPEVKKELVAFFNSLPDDVIIRFTSPRYEGKKCNNTGEIVTIRYQDPELKYSVQIDNIIAITANEANFKRKFLDLPAEKQGLILGLCKVATVESFYGSLFYILGIQTDIVPRVDQEWEFNLSSSELQLRLVTYKPNTTIQDKHEVMWVSSDWEDVRRLLYQWDLNVTFDEFLNQIKLLKKHRSKVRVIGVFNSMITVKSGEVGTPKGLAKEQARDKIKAALS